jgi:hypothetical protein
MDTARAAILGIVLSALIGMVWLYRRTRKLSKTKHWTFVLRQHLYQFHCIHGVGIVRQSPREVEIEVQTEGGSKTYRLDPDRDPIELGDRIVEDIA